MKNKSKVFLKFFLTKNTRMGDMSDSEEEELAPIQNKKPAYTSQTRDLSTKPAKKQKTTGELDQEPSSSEEEDDDSLLKPLAAEEEEEDDFARQLRLEKEESLRKASVAEQNEAKKTKIDPEDGTEYEWDPQIKGWFPKLPEKQFIDYQKNYGVCGAPGNTYYLYNGAFYKFDFADNKWIAPDSTVYSYVDYMTGVCYDWSEEKNSWVPKIAASSNNLTTPVANVQAKTESTKPVNDQSKAKKKEGWVEVSEDKNTNVYVSGMPLGLFFDFFCHLLS
jgi:hypothetical protein